MWSKRIEGMTRLVHGLVLASVIHQSQGFSGVCPFDPASFRQLSPWRPAAGACSLRRPGPSSALLSPAASRTSRTFRNTSCACRHSNSNHDDDQYQQRRQRPPRWYHEGAMWRFRRRPTLPSPSPSALCAIRESSSSSSSSRVPSEGSSPGELGVREDEREGAGGSGGLAEDAGKSAPRMRKPKKGGGKKDKSVLGKAGDALKATFNVFMAASTVVSLALAAEAVWQLHGTQLTLSNAVPTLTKLLPLTGIGVFGAAQLVGLVARVVRVIVTLPIMLSGTWVILQNAPKGSDLTGAGSLAAVLATPEVLEAAAVVALLGGTAIWALNFATGAVGALISGQRDPSQEDLEDEDELV